MRSVSTSEIRPMVLPGPISFNPIIISALVIINLILAGIVIGSCFDHQFRFQFNSRKFFLFVTLSVILWGVGSLLLD